MSNNSENTVSENGLAQGSGRLDGQPVSRSEEGSTRRSFLRSTAKATAVPVALMAGASALEAADYSGSLPFQKDSHWVRNHIQNIVNNENAHLQALLTELGAYARPKPTFQNLAPANLTQFVKMGSMFCSVGAGAYLGATPYIQNPYLMNQAGSIGQVELTQSGFLNSLLDLPLLNGGSPYAVSLTLSDVITMASPFVASLNGGPPLTFSTTEKSLENDINIFNVALLLEYLEHEFYNTYAHSFFA